MTLLDRKEDIRIKKQTQASVGPDKRVKCPKN